VSKRGIRSITPPDRIRATSRSVDVAVLVLVIQVAAKSTGAGADQRTFPSAAAQGTDQGTASGTHERAATGTLAGRGATSGDCGRRERGSVSLDITQAPRKVNGSILRGCVSVSPRYLHGYLSARARTRPMTGNSSISLALPRLRSAQATKAARPSATVAVFG